MINTYDAILHDNRIEWSGTAPPDLQTDRAIRVRVTILDALAPGAISNHGQRMADALHRLAEGNESQELPDAAIWEREIRQDRSLPGRSS